MERNRSKLRKRRHLRNRKNIFGTGLCPRLCVYKSLKNIYAQIINDEEGTTLVSSSTLSPEIKGELTHKGNIAAAVKTGELIGKKASEKGIKKVVFDRGGYIYHGKIKAFGDSARKAGLEF